MVRQTSLEAYNHIKENNLLNRLQWQVYEALYKYGPATQQELWFRCFQDTQARNIMPRFAELERMGLLDSLEKRPCSITKRKCMVWDVTSRLPIKLERKKTKDQIIQMLTDKINFLECQLNESRQEIQRLKKGELF